MRLVTAAQMREIDRQAIEEYGVPAAELMEAAGRTIAVDIAESFERGTVAVLAGKGNNGGDGFVAARYLHRAGWKVVVIYHEMPNRGEAFRCWGALPDEIQRIPWSSIPAPAGLLSEFDVLLDALLGTGSALPLREPYPAIIAAMNAARVPIVSADIPSGLDPDTGEGDPVVKAARTITFGLPKVGMMSGQGPVYCGRIRVEALAFPADLLEGAPPFLTTLTPTEARALLPARPREGHKGVFGRVVVAAGSEHTPGAAILAVHGALRSGCGLVELLAPAPIRPLVITSMPEVIAGTPCGTSHLEPLPKEMVDARLLHADALVLGPGIGMAPETLESVRSLLSYPDCPRVLDADALNLLAADDGLQRLLRPGDILTPHPGEAGRLLGTAGWEVQEDRWKSARALARKYGCIVVLKGAGTLVADPDGNVCHIGSGNTGLARGGAGDVLAGLIGGLLAQGCAPWDAARLAVFAHGLAADQLVREQSSRGMRILDVAEQLPLAFREIERA
ncbi:NAD(P)H-hydrate dehydratase [bacterium]|nr:NAD(P)H-hydrate dehydratase [bacterium]